MKNLFLFTVLMIGLSISSQAQNLDYEIINTTSASWKLRMQDAGSSSTTSEILMPSTSALGTIAGFGFTLKWIVSSTSGCLAYSGAFVPTGPAGASFTDSCGNVHTYSIIEVSPGDFKLKMQLN